MGELSFSARGLAFAYPGAAQPAIDDVTVDASSGEVFGIVGPNGSGKTTLLRLLLGVLEPSAGTVEAFGRPAGTWRRREMARLVGVVSQREEPTFPLRVRQAVALGRYPHVGPFGPLAHDDRAAVDDALRQCDVAELADRWVSTLSGGEWQRVRLARALAQEPHALVLDEATANLDMGHEMEVFDLVARLVRERGLAGVLVTHHVNLAARFADRLLVLDAGRPIALGRPAEVLTREVLSHVFRWPVELFDWHGIPQFVPLRREEAE